MSGAPDLRTGLIPSVQDLIEGVPTISPNDFVPFDKNEIDKSISERFEEQVRKHSDQVAVKVQNRIVTYSELNQIANRIARAILSQPAGGAAPIALLLEKDASMFAAMLGVLKAGRAYVPLDPAHPHRRFQKLLGDAGIELVITDNRCLHLAEKLVNGSTHLLNMDVNHSHLSTDNIGLKVSSDSSCYVIYTSGSTGQPKGVVQNHRSVLHNIRWHTNSLQLCAHDRFTLLASCAAGQSVTDIYAALLNGATLYPFDLRKEGLTGLTTLLIDEGITVYHSSASLFSYFVNSLSGNEEFLKLRFIKLGGEAVSKKEVDMYKKHFSSECRLVNTLSATETGTVRQYVIDKNTTVTGNIVPVGYPVDDKRILLLNETGQEIGFGEVGEICIDSPYLALGYWHQPDATSAVFTSSPGGEERRIYRSGDLGRMDPQSCLTYLGRKDSRVKISGHTIEIAEVEAALRSLVGIADVAVAARNHSGEQRLVAYVVSERDIDLSPGTLRKLLGEALPEHMIPSSFQILHALPRTPNGKVACEELAAAEAFRPTLKYTAPGTDMEKKLERIWAGVLKLDRVSVHDNFFDLGGNSLMALKLIKGIEKASLRRVSLASLFQAPTISELAILLSASDSPEEGDGVIRIQPEGSKPPLFCIGIGPLYRLLALRLGLDQPFICLSTVKSDIKALPAPFLLEDIAACLVRKLISIQPSGPYFIGGWCRTGLLAYEVAQRLRARGETVSLLVLFDTVNVGWWREHATSPGFADRLNLHTRKFNRYLAKLAKLSWRKQWEEFSAAWNYGKEKFKYKVRLPYYKFYLAMHGHFGNRFAEFFNVKYVGIAAHNYLPKPYSGRVLLIWSASQFEHDAQDCKMSWSGLLVGSSEVHHIPGGHRDMFLEPNVGVLADILKDCLLTAQETDDKSSSGTLHRAQNER